MRIVIDLQCCQTDSRKRGIGRQARELALAMCRDSGRHEIHLALSNLFPEQVQGIKKDFATLLPASRFAVWDAPKKFQLPHEAVFWRERAGEILREDYLCSLRPDVIHISSLFEGTIDDALTSIPEDNRGVAHSVTLHDLIPFKDQDLYFTEASWRRRYLRKISQLNNASGILAISDYTRRQAIDLLGLDPAKIHTVPCAADTMFRETSITDEQSASLRKKFALKHPFVMYTGGAEPRKNVSRLIEAFAALPDNAQAGYQLAIVGDVAVDHREQLDSLLRRLGLRAGAVLFTGYVSDEELARLYNICACFVFPSLEEGFGLPVLEAMSCGAPTVGSNATSIPEVIGRQDALFDPFKVESIASKLSEVLCDEGFRAELREHGLQRSGTFSWRESARLALSAMEQACEWRGSNPVAVGSRARSKPRLAYVSPLPPERSGVARYSADLLPWLAKYYEIEVITDQSGVADSATLANFPLRTADWFDLNARGFDRIIYSLGNSPFHKYMLALLERHPGVVALHDFFLSSLFAWAQLSGESPSLWDSSLYHSHGYTALLESREGNRAEAIREFPCNRRPLEWATGIIVHSKHAASLADAWYGEGTSRDWAIIPHLRAEAKPGQRARARERLGFAPGNWVVCSFGHIDFTKCSLRIVQAWLSSALADDPAGKLVFVGSNAGDAYGEELAREISRRGTRDRIRITGYVEDDIYQLYLAACDCAVQLRTCSRGESSGAILDCLSHGVPSIVNAHGSLSELPEEVVLRLDDAFTNEQLAGALEHLRGDEAAAAILRTNSRHYVATSLGLAACASAYHDAVEKFALAGRHSLLPILSEALGRLQDQPSCSPEESDWCQLAESIAANAHPMGAARQMIVDVTELAQRNLGTGIQRVQHAILKRLLTSPPDGFRVEPVYASEGRYYYARKFTCEFLSLRDVTLPDDPLETGPQDILLSLDWGIEIVPFMSVYLAKMRNRGVKMYFLIYDLLPATLPDCFPECVKKPFTPWLASLAALADGLVCISRAVADELAVWLDQARVERPPNIGYFHLGSDIEAGEFKELKSEVSSNEPAVMQPYFLMVSTIEPRKGHGQMLAAFESLWSSGFSHNLVIVGKYGHSMEAFAARLRAHPLLGKRVFWLEAPSDRLLTDAYKGATALIAASRGEGFGLPLVEAARHGVPIIARDLPVFHEVAGEHAWYFSGESPEAAARAVTDWMKLRQAGAVPQPGEMPIIDWSESAGQLLGAILGGQWYKKASLAAEAVSK